MIDLFSLWRAARMSAISALLIASPTLATQTAQAAPKTQSQFTPLTGQALRDVFTDTVMIGEYHTKDGETGGQSYKERHHSDGTTDYREDKTMAQKNPVHETGIWNILGDQKICYQYPKSKLHLQTYCFFVYEKQGCYYKYSLSAMRAITPTEYRPRHWDYWSSRAVRKGSGQYCAAPIS